jgi:hypothetical protein
MRLWRPPRAAELCYELMTRWQHVLGSRHGNAAISALDRHFPAFSPHRHVTQPSCTFENPL